MSFQSVHVVTFREERVSLFAVAVCPRGLLAVYLQVWGINLRSCRGTRGDAVLTISLSISARKMLTFFVWLSRGSLDAIISVMLN